jgi:hypothetical protein
MVLIYFGDAVWLADIVLNATVFAFVDQGILIREPHLIFARCAGSMRAAAAG